MRTADLIEATGASRPEISSLRLPGVVANQSVVFGALGQTLELRHVTTSRDAFVPGMLVAVRGVRALAPGLHVVAPLLNVIVRVTVKSSFFTLGW